MKGRDVIARDRRRLNDPENWRAKSLAVNEELGNWPGMATTFGLLGLLAEDRGQPRQVPAAAFRCGTGGGRTPVARTTLKGHACGPAHALMRQAARN